MAVRHVGTTGAKKASLPRRQRLAVDVGQPRQHARLDLSPASPAVLFHFASRSRDRRLRSRISVPSLRPVTSA
jgi:hypothetical protein